MHFLSKAKHYVMPSRSNAYQPQLLHKGWLLFFLALIVGTEGFLVSDLVARQTNVNFLAAVIPAEIIALTNDERAQNNVGTLTENKLLDQAAQAKAEDMAKNDYFAHVGPNGKTPWQWIAGSGYQYQYAGENLAVRFVDSKDVVNAWMASPSHRANIVKPVYTAIGVGVAEGLFEGQPATYVVQYFAAPYVASGEVAAAPYVAPSKVGAAPKTTPGSNVAPAASPQIAANQGESAAIAASPASFTQTLLRQIGRALAEPEGLTELILGIVAALLLLVLVLTLVIHAHIQPWHLLARGAAVAAIAIVFFALNASLNLAINTPQAASVAEASGSASAAGTAQAVVIGTDSAQTGFALFPLATHRSAR